MSVEAHSFGNAKRKPLRAGSAWDEKKDAELRQLCLAGHRRTDIAIRLGVSVHCINRRATALNLPALQFHWREEALADLCRLNRNKVPLETIAEHFGLPVSSIRKKLYRLGQAHRVNRPSVHGPIVEADDWQTSMRRQSQKATEQLGHMMRAAGYLV